MVLAAHWAIGPDGVWLSEAARGTGRLGVPDEGMRERGSERDDSLESDEVWIGIRATATRCTCQRSAVSDLQPQWCRLLFTSLLLQITTDMGEQNWEHQDVRAPYEP